MSTVSTDFIILIARNHLDAMLSSCLWLTAIYWYVTIIFIWHRSAYSLLTIAFIMANSFTSEWIKALYADKNIIINLFMFIRFLFSDDFILVFIETRSFRTKRSKNGYTYCHIIKNSVHILFHFRSSNALKIISIFLTFVCS